MAQPTVTKPVAKPPAGSPQDKSNEGVPASRTDTKEETRLFQVGDGKVWLTESEAKAKGLYWRDEKKLGKA